MKLNKLLFSLLTLLSFSSIADDVPVILRNELVPYAFRTNTIEGITTAESGGGGFTTSTNNFYYNFRLGDTSGYFSITPGSLDYTTAGNNGFSFSDGLLSLSGGIRSQGNTWNFPDTTVGSNYIFAAKSDIPDVSDLPTKSYVDTHQWDYETQVTNKPNIKLDRITSLDGDTEVIADNSGNAVLTHINSVTYGTISVSFPAGFSVVNGTASYTASTKESFSFPYGPYPTGSGGKTWLQHEPVGTNYQPSNEWYLEGPVEWDNPYYLTYRSNIGNFPDEIHYQSMDWSWDSTSPNVEIIDGTESGGHPTLSRTASYDTSTNILSTLTYVNNTSNNIVSLIPDVSDYALDTNVVHAIKDSYGDYHVNSGLFVNKFISSRVNNNYIDLLTDEERIEIGLDDDHNVSFSAPIIGRTFYDASLILVNGEFNYSAPTNSGYITLTQNPDGTPDVELPSNIALTKTIGGENWITNSVGFDSIINRKYYKWELPSFNKYTYDHYNSTTYNLLASLGEQHIFEDHISENVYLPPSIWLYDHHNYSHTNIWEGNLIGYAISTEGESPYPDVIYGLLGIYFGALDSEDNEYWYDYLFPTNHTTKYFALTDDPNGVIDVDLIGYVPYEVDINSNKTALTIGHRDRSGASYVGSYSTALGIYNDASGSGSIAAGLMAYATNELTVVWQGDGDDPDAYYDHGEGTFNIKPVPQGNSDDPASGFYIGESNLVDIVNTMIDVKLAQLDLFTANDVTNIIRGMVETGFVHVDGTNYVLVVQRNENGGVKPYVPTGYPVYVKCIDHSAGYFEYTIEIQGYNGPASTGSGFNISVSNGLVTITDSGVDLFSFDSNFNITPIMDNLEIEWIDPSTLLNP